MAEFAVIGKPAPRVDALEKLTGQARYAADLQLPGMVHARLVLSPHAHARIVRIDRSGALGRPGVVAVLTAEDLPALRGDSSRKAEPLARDEVRFNGQPVAVVLAESEAAAEDGAALVQVEYEPLPAVTDPLAALAPDAPRVRVIAAAGAEETQLHATVGGERVVEAEPAPPNVTGRVRFRRGDVAAGFGAADAVVEATYRAAWVHQSYLEPQAAVAAFDPLGNLTIWSSTQTLFYTRQEVAALLGLPTHRVKIVGMPVGGGFGGKFVLIEPLLAVIAVAAKRPVRLVLTRMEEFLATNPSPQCIIEVKTGARRDGTLTALQARVVFDTGVYPGSPLQIACLLLGGYYRFPNLDIHGYEVLTNRFGPGAYRAPGAPQATFAIESQLDELARKLGLDPLELRLRNAVAEGDPQPDGTPWPRIGLRECLERLRAHPAWRDRGAPPRGGDAAGRREGVGIAVGGWPGGLEPAAAACRLDNDGRVTVVTGSVDLTGTNTTLALIAAEVLGLRPDQVRVVNGDSDAAPFAGVSGGSKITYTVGAAVRRAAEDARQQILRIAADVLESSVEDLEIVDGTVQVRGAPARALPLAEIGRLSTTFGARFAPVDGRGTSAITANAPGFAAQLARVAVDEETGAVAVRRYVAVQDVGRALNPAAVEGQLHGGVAQGIGWALYEQMVFDEDGRLLTASFLDYAVPSATHVPPIETAFVEVPSADGPFGAKGVGEPPVVPGAAAVANAVRDAVGVRVTEIPITPERLLRALRRLA